VLFEIDAGDSDLGADPWGGEPVLRDGEYVGYLTSAGYGHCAGRTLALGYVRSDAIASNAAYDVEVIGEPRPARRLERPPIDPDGERMRG
jgi:dimethylglycine dehydrogenase